MSRKYVLAQFRSDANFEWVRSLRSILVTEELKYAKFREAIDEIQAADIAAGWAREVLETNDANTLGARFERVWVNGRRIK